MERNQIGQSRATAVAYYRYSPGRLQGEQSIEGQAAEAHKWAAEHDVQILREYADRKISGRSDDRAEFQTMLKELDKIRPTYLILWKLDRMGRNREELAFNKHKCKKAGVKIVYVAETIPDTPEGVILESVMEGMAEYYSLQLSSNIRRGQRNAAAKCQVIGGRKILGYRTGADKRYEIDPNEAAVVREIFRRYADGETQSDIARWLNSAGHRTQRNTLYTVNSLRTLLKNEKYTGVYLWKDEVRVEGGMPAIIEREVWEKAQKRMRTNKAAPSKREDRSEFLLTGKLFCGHCGGSMSGTSGTSRSGTPHYYYTCASRHKKTGGNGCKKKNVRKDWIEETVLRHVRYLLNKEDLLEEIADKCYAAYQAEKADTSYVDALQASLKEVDISLANLLRAIEAGIFNATTAARMAQLEEEKQQILAEIEVSKMDTALHLTREHILFFLLKLRELDLDDEACRQKLFDTFVNAIFVYDDKIVLTFNYSGDGSQITLQDIDESDADVFLSPALLSTIPRRAEHYVVVIRNVFALYVKTEGC